MTYLNELAQQIHTANKEKGFWEGKPCPNRFCDHFADRPAAEVLLLIGSEVAEAFEAVRDGYDLADDATDWISGPNTVDHSISQVTAGGPVQAWLTHENGEVLSTPVVMDDAQFLRLGYEAKPVGVPSEIADIIIRTLDAAAAWGIDLDAAVARKLAYNATRPHKHGRKS